MNKKRRFFAGLFPLLLGLSDPTEYRKKHTYKVKYASVWRFRDHDLDRQLQTFFVHGEPIMAYSKKDAIKRWVHRDLKNRRRARR